MGSGSSKHKQPRAYHPTERPSPPGKPVLVPAPPDADQDVITIKWDPPIYGGGSKIIGYLVEHKRTVSPHWVKATPLLVRQHQLSLSGLEPGARYQFRVSAENGGGRSEPSPLSEPVAVSHQRGAAVAPLFLTTLRDTTAIENEKVEFIVKIEGTPFPRISWYKDGFEVFSNRRQRVSTDGNVSSLIIHQAALSDEGEIKCCATNKAGHAVARATLKLQAPPTIRLPRQYEDGILFELGESVKLKVSVSGRPHPEVMWYHNGKQVEPGPRVECTTTEKYAMLKVSNGTREDRGEYQVRAVNPLGEDSASLLVTITDRPLPPGKVNVVMTLGRCVTLAWTIPYDDGGCKIGNYIVEYFRIGWNMWLKAATCRQLTTTIGDLIEGSEYKFRVKAENPYGISDPSEESDIIFIPDPKRGLLEPPPRGSQKILDEMPEEWLTSRVPELKVAADARDWDEDDSPIPSPVILANQVLQKVKHAPRRGWSEDSQGSPPPVPRRRHKARDKPSPVPDEEYSEKSKPERRWEKELSPRSNMDDDLHSSSEMMLVLLPDKNRTAADDRGTSNAITVPDFESEGSIAPPMSLSAPELSSCEPFDFQELRLSASSSEIMHELSLIRFNKEASEEEAEQGLKKRYGLERRRSFERKSSRGRDNFSSSKENLPTPDQLLAKRKELLQDLESRRTKRLSDSSDELEEVESRLEKFSERFLSLERGFKEYAALTSMKIREDDESDKMSSIYSEEDEDYEEDTYHPRNMTPNNIKAVSPHEHAPAFLHKPPMVTITEEPEPLRTESHKGNQTLSERVLVKPANLFRRSLTPEREAVERFGTTSLKSQREPFQRSRTPSPLTPEEETYHISRTPSPNLSLAMGKSVFERSRTPSPNLRLTPDKSAFQRSRTPSPNLMPEKSPFERSRTPSPNLTPTPEKSAFQRSRTPSPSLSPAPSPRRSRSPSPNIVIDTSPQVLEKHEPPVSPMTPKPILKVRDKSLERMDSSQQNLLNKKVRIELPERKDSEKESIDANVSSESKIAALTQEENEMGLAAGEVARNRRRKQPPPIDPSAKVIIDHYSDIVREYGQTKKPATKLYLSYEELKAAAERSLQEKSEPVTNSNQAGAQQETDRASNLTTPERQETTQNANILPKTVAINRKSKFYLEYMLDVFLFLVACWLYFFKDIRLTIPILLLMLYRQLNETVTKMLKYRPFGNKKS